MSIVGETRAKTSYFDHDDTLKNWGFEGDHCFHCGIKNSELSGLLMQCGKCKKAYYCGMKCFNAALPEHSKWCTTKAIYVEPKKGGFSLPDPELKNIVKDKSEVLGKFHQPISQELKPEKQKKSKSNDEGKQPKKDKTLKKEKKKKKEKQEKKKKKKQKISEEDPPKEETPQVPPEPLAEIIEVPVEEAAPIEETPIEVLVEEPVEEPPVVEPPVVDPPVVEPPVVEPPVEEPPVEESPVEVEIEDNEGSLRCEDLLPHDNGETKEEEKREHKIKLGKGEILPRLDHEREIIKLNHIDRKAPEKLKSGEIPINLRKAPLPTKSQNSKTELPHVNLNTGVEANEKQDYDWKPDWLESSLRATEIGEKIKTIGDIRYREMRASSNDEKELTKQKPIWAQKSLLKKTGAGDAIKKGVDPIRKPTSLHASMPDFDFNLDDSNSDHQSSGSIDAQNLSFNSSFDWEKPVWARKNILKSRGIRSQIRRGADVRKATQEYTSNSTNNKLHCSMGNLNFSGGSDDHDDGDDDCDASLPLELVEEKEYEDDTDRSMSPVKQRISKSVTDRSNICPVIERKKPTWEKPVWAQKSLLKKTSLGDALKKGVDPIRKITSTLHASMADFDFNLEDSNSDFHSSGSIDVQNLSFNSSLGSEKPVWARKNILKNRGIQSQITSGVDVRTVTKDYNNDAINSKLHCSMGNIHFSGMCDNYANNGDDDDDDVSLPLEFVEEKEYEDDSLRSNEDTIFKKATEPADSRLLIVSNNAIGERESATPSKVFSKEENIVHPPSNVINAGMMKFDQHRKANASANARPCTVETTDKKETRLKSPKDVGKSFGSTKKSIEWEKPEWTRKSFLKNVRRGGGQKTSGGKDLAHDATSVLHASMMDIDWR